VEPSRASAVSSHIMSCLVEKSISSRFITAATLSGNVSLQVRTLCAVGACFSLTAGFGGGVGSLTGGVGSLGCGVGGASATSTDVADEVVDFSLGGSNCFSMAATSGSPKSKGGR